MAAVKSYGACLAGLLYDHQIDPALQQGHWIRFPDSAKTPKLVAGEVPYQLSNLTAAAYSSEPGRMALLAGMAIIEDIPGTEMGVGEPNDHWRTVQRPISDMSAHTLITHTARAFPVVIPPWQKELKTIMTYAMVQSPASPQYYELRRVSRHQVFFFGSVRDAGDSLTTPATRASRWYENIRTKIEKGPHAPPVLAAKTSKRFTDPRKRKRAQSSKPSDEQAVVSKSDVPKTPTGQKGNYQEAHQEGPAGQKRNYQEAHQERGDYPKPRHTHEDHNQLPEILPGIAYTKVAPTEFPTSDSAVVVSNQDLFIPRQPPPLKQQQAPTSLAIHTSPTPQDAFFRTAISHALSYLTSARQPIYSPETPWASSSFLNDLETQILRVDAIRAREQLAGGAGGAGATVRLIKMLVKIVDGRVNEACIAADAGEGVVMNAVFVTGLNGLVGRLVGMLEGRE
ncbi:hypothetical protein BDZ85DRAFT_283028 [Elsinoe ampelina]|uniref:Uncharacterized protein n=1 Tax=Elsinoe ampelina TaxID=302913 RepID=A0A6A6G947_9PEZI|nr:hypothetical protein BDZ85DRAFT_283028 [Elsinoe ampelina]